MKYKKVYVKNKIINHLISKGNKEISENLLLKTFKEFQKNLPKESKKLINLGIIFSIPVFKIHTTLKKTKKKKIKETPVMISNRNFRVSSSIKFILSVLERKTSKHSYIKFYEEITLNIKSESQAFLTKNKIQKNALLKKHFLYYYRW